MNSKNGVSLSHFNLKSSVLCLETNHITIQYLALEQLAAHHQMVSRAKGAVDLSAPKSMHSYIGSMDRKKKGLRQSLNPFNIQFNPTASKTNDNYHEIIRDNISAQSDSSLNKGIQTGIAMPNVDCKVADKITWYLEAVSQGEFKVLENWSQIPSERGYQRRSSSQVSLSSSLRAKPIKGDLIDWHKNSFTTQNKAFSPRLLANNTAKSKVRGMKCYNPAKKSPSSNSTDNFESYEEEEESVRESEDEIEEDSNLQNTQRSNELLENGSADNKNEWLNEQALRVHVRNKLRRKQKHHSVTPQGTAQTNTQVTQPSPLRVFSRDDEEKYLKFLVDVTEDILKSGIYTDRAIHRTFEFHLQFYPKNDDKVKLRQLLDQVLEGLKIPNRDSDNSLIKRSAPINLSKENTNSFSSTPPEKENADTVVSELERFRFHDQTSANVTNPNDAMSTTQLIDLSLVQSSSHENGLQNFFAENS